MTLLVTRAVTKRFGGLLAVNKLDFDVDEGAIVSVIGPNGAGKTTFFNCIAGFYNITSGEIELDGQPIHKLRRDQIAHLGVSRTYQNIRLFANMTAMENILVGQHHHLTSTWIGTVLGTKSVKEDEKRAQDEAGRLLRYVGLRGKGDMLASKLPYGDQRRLEIARALANKPRLLLLDEPTAGMNPAETAQTDRLHPQPARRARDHDPAHRARDAGGDGHLGAHHGARLRREDRRGQPCRDPVEPARHRGLPRARRRGGPRHRRQRGKRGERHEPRRPRGADGLTMALLEVDDIHTYYGNIHALKGVSLAVEEGEIVTLIGANGAGKTTTLNTISGIIRPRSGSVRLDGRDLAFGRPAQDRRPRASSRSPRAAGPSRA